MPTTDWSLLGAHELPLRAEPPSRVGGTQEEIAWALSSLAVRLEASEENFRTLVETVDDIVVVASLDGRIRYANPALSRRLGYRPVEVRSLCVSDLYPPRIRAEAEAVHAEIARGERGVCSLPLQARSGALVPVETRAWPGRWNDEDCLFRISRDSRPSGPG